MCSTAPTTRASGWSLLYSFRKNFYQVDVSTRGCCNDRSPRHISSSSSSEISYPGWLWKYAVSFLNLSYLSGVGRCRIFWALSNLLPDAACHLPHLLHQRALQLPGKNHRSGAGKDRRQQQQICFSNWSLQEICNLLIDHACRYINPPTIFTIEVKYYRALLSFQTHGRLKRRSTKSRKRRKLSRSSNHASRCSHSLFGMNFPVERRTRRNAPPTSRRIQKNGISTKIWFSIDSTPFSIAWTLCWTAAIQQTNFSCSRRFGIFL